MQICLFNKLNDTLLWNWPKASGLLEAFQTKLLLTIMNR